MYWSDSSFSVHLILSTDIEAVTANSIFQLHNETGAVTSLDDVII